MTHNINPEVVDDFGREWSTFDQSELSKAELETIFQQYFAIFPWQQLSPNAQGFDLGCGSGRWAYFCAPQVGQLHCIDPSPQALAVAQNKLRSYDNCHFHCASVDEIPLADNSMDFGYSLGVLHHVPDTAAGIQSCVQKLKPNAPFLLYLYYAFDNKPTWFRWLWRISDFGRQIISRLPYSLKYATSQLIAITIYWPFSRMAWLLGKMGVNAQNLPLSAYRDKSFYTLRTDALDRFGTRLEQRFTRPQITQMMQNAGLENIQFSDNMPFWCAIGYKKP